ncbi:hypothetical protein EV682_109122 [Iodobacter fluviatilis]|uniref:Uncharacterized protein n=1 Tax=Iodobacter fluviatilis TaxID=537 RepID=A0A377Q5G3_9NEIS|nr:hypothetical protein EV682_109122 [Iodobacter fluviatilis]STQ90062.1 Uncharacterised protein [Iodobacter fluviatilis]
MVKKHNFAARKMADHFRVVGLAGAGGFYVAGTKVSGDEYIIICAIGAILIWMSAFAAATLLDLIFGEPDQ